MRGKALRVLLALLVSGGLLVLVLSRLDAGAAVERVAGAHPGWVGLAALLSLGTLLCRGLRFVALVGTPPGLTTAAVAVQGLLIRVTPFRLGELALPYLLKRHAGEDPAQVLVHLVLVRLADLCLITASIAAAALARMGPDAPGATATVVGLLVGQVFVLTFFRPLLRLGLGWAAWAARVSRLDRLPAVAHILGRLVGAVEKMDRIRPRTLAALGVLSLAVLVLQTFTFSCLLRALGGELPILAVLQGSSVAQLGVAVPVASVGAVGTLEASWAAGFVWVGLPLKDALETGVGVQVLTLAFSAVFGLPGWFYLAQRARRRITAR